MEFRIISITNAHPDFYPLMGPFLAQREIAKVLGEPLWDDDGTDWFIALGSSGEVLGFAAVRHFKSHVLFDSCYVIPQHRRQGIATAFVDERLFRYTGTTIKVIANQNSFECYAKKGFVTTRQTKNYYFMSKEKVDTNGV